MCVNYTDTDMVFAVHYELHYRRLPFFKGYKFHRFRGFLDFHEFFSPKISRNPIVARISDCREL